MRYEFDEPSGSEIARTRIGARRGRPSLLPDARVLRPVRQPSVGCRDGAAISVSHAYV